MLQVRFHADFKGKDTVLFAGSLDDLVPLRTFFVNWDGQELELLRHLAVAREIYLHNVKYIRVVRNDLQDSFIWSEGNGLWTISYQYQIILIGLMDALLHNNSPCHQYLYDYFGSVQIIASKDEYSVDATGAFRAHIDN